MHAAQNPIDQVLDVATGLPAGLVELINALPTVVRLIVVVLIVASLTVPRLLRALDDHLVLREARQRVTKNEDWVEMVRIRNEPRRMIGRREAPEPRGTAPDPKPAGGADARTGSRDDEPPGDEEAPP
jgi:hypothetical protein